MRIKSKFDHFNFNVTNLDVSLKFYETALGLKEVKRKASSDGSFILVYLGDEYNSNFLLELTWLKDHPQKYNLGECEFHLCLRVPGDYDTTREFHKSLDCIVYENEAMGLYFITDPDGYWIEILPLSE